MKLISWNVNGIRANCKKGGFDWLLQQNADFFCLQETKAHPEQLEEGIRNPVGYYAYFDHSKGRKGYSGVATYAKEKPERTEYILGVPECDQEGRFIALFYPDFVLINCYFPNGGGGPERLDFKMRFYDEFLKYVNKQRAAGLEIIFCGDINTAHQEIDLARPKENEKHTGFLPQERAWIDQVIQAGYIDIYRHQNPSKTGAYTWWDMKTFARERNVGWRIDYFFISPGLLKKVEKVKIHNMVMGSDHCPIELTLK
ncbi:MAG TPA: exodeoxyribonuclease III [Candidatus Paceibacterota bacterium]